MSRPTCPSCGSISAYGPDEDGDEVCHKCGGPSYCTKCSEPILEITLGDDRGFSCEVCGEKYHDTCFPKLGSDTIICQGCYDDSGTA